MDTYVILRRNGWSGPDALQAAAERSTQVGDGEMSNDIRWIRSYVLDEGDGAVGTVSSTRRAARRRSGTTRHAPTCPSTRSSPSRTRSSSAWTRSPFRLRRLTTPGSRA